MKKHLLLCAALLTVSMIVWAQKPDTALILVHYKFSHVLDTNNRAHPYTENMVLFVGKASSSYKSYDAQLQNELYRRQLQEQVSAGGNFRLDRNIAGSGTEYYQFTNSGKLVRKEMLLDAYIIDNVLPSINWHISGNTANFDELRCQKATCHFKGRDYIAWFCPDLPVRVGPWKLNGLPGVIVEAYDAKKEVVFKFDRVEKAVLGAHMQQIKDRHGRILVPLGDDDYGIDPNIIRAPARGIKTTDKEFEKLYNTMHKDPNALAHSMEANPQNLGAPKTDVSMRKSSTQPVNNPIELTEK